MVLSAPMIQIADAQLNGLSPGVAWVASEVATLLGLGRLFVPGGGPPPPEASQFEGNPLTSDRERYMRTRAVLEEEPALAIGDPTIGWLRAAFRSMAHLQAPDTPGTMRVPMMFVVAGEDQVVSATAVEDFALRTKLGTRVLMASSRHEILQETDEIRSRFWAAFDAYLSAAAAAA
jgi:lysophospholipase